MRNTIPTEVPVLLKDKAFQVEFNNRNYSFERKWDDFREIIQTWLFDNIAIPNELDEKISCLANASMICLYLILANEASFEEEVT